eukprot:Sspe_Gene.115581::Locus_103183_Transcript_1_1_Confidence_1.000_Length_925::g.115581::m.115581
MLRLWGLLVLCVGVQGVSLYGHWAPPSYDEASGTGNQPVTKSCSSPTTDKYGTVCTPGGLKLDMSTVPNNWYLIVWMRLTTTTEDLIEIFDDQGAQTVASLNNNYAAIFGGTYTLRISTTTNTLKWVLIGIYYEDSGQAVLYVNGKSVIRRTWGSTSAASIEIVAKPTIGVGEVKLLTDYKETACSTIPVGSYCPTTGCSSSDSFMVHSLQEYLLASMVLHASSGSTRRLAYDQATGTWGDGSMYNPPETTGSGSDYCLDEMSFEARSCTSSSSYICANSMVVKPPPPPPSPPPP